MQSRAFLRHRGATDAAILVDYARGQRADKRSGDAVHLALNEALDEAAAQDTDLLALDDALARLAACDPRQSRIVELRYFGGLTIEETAAALEIGHSTAEPEWMMARVAAVRNRRRLNAPVSTDER